MARLYADENFPLPAVEALRQLGHTVVTAQEAGKADRAVPDHEVLEYAAQQNLALVTLNRRHFIRLHRESSDHAGIIACTFDRDFTGQAERIHAVLAAETSLAGKLLRVNRPSS